MISSDFIDILQTQYIDILLLYCLASDGWNDQLSDSQLVRCVNEIEHLNDGKVNNNNSDDDGWSSMDDGQLLHLADQLEQDESVRKEARRLERGKCPSEYLKISVISHLSLLIVICYKITYGSIII